MTDWNLRLLRSSEELAAVEELQRSIWPSSDLDVVPAHLLLTAAHNGGLVAGAFAEGRLIGFVFGFLGLDEAGHPPRLRHCSHMLGVHADFRDAGVGYELKRFQWAFVQAQGLDRVTWTYDPLLAGNAQLNIAKLGAVCNTYLRNYYGAMRDALNAGLPSDRFQVDWWVNREHVVANMTGARQDRMDLAGCLAAGAALIDPLAKGQSMSRQGSPLASSIDASQAWPMVLVEIPPDFPAVKSSDPRLALAWRMGVRQTFETLFAQGFTVHGFVRQAGPRPRAAYVLRRTPPALP